MNTQHTPGPWKQNDHPDKHNQLYVRLGTGCANAIVERKDTFGKVSDEDIANARLIAAAPDLLAVLEKLLPFAVQWVQYSKPMTEADKIIEECYAALTKALQP